jgi:hypothetical protein
MKLELKRVALKDTYTIGKLYIDGVYFCDTLEDHVRDMNKDGDLNDKGEGKVFGETAIPYGTYKVIMNMSNRFKRVMPLILDVPHFAGIRIHSGSKAEHSHGCILVGINDIKGRLSQSKRYETELYIKLSTAKDITIEIK